MFLKKMIAEGLREIGPYNKKKLKLLFPEHHMSHAASAFYPSPFKEAAILTIDGVGEWATATIGRGKDNKIELLKEMKFPHSVGLLYSAFTYFLGFRVNSGEYKLMGLAPYGNPNSEQTKKFIALIKENIVDIKEDGSIWLNQSFFNYATGLKMIHESKWEHLFGFKKVMPDGNLEQQHCNLAYAIQNVIEEIVIRMAMEAKKITGSDHLCMSGGVALNCVANGKLLKEIIFKEIYIQPASGDAGGALGAALAAHYLYFDQARESIQSPDSMKGAYLGPAFSDKEIVTELKNYKAVYHKYESFDELCDKVAGLIDQGNVIGWFQGRMEFGPRALGNRSILADARNKEMQKQLNLKIKYREGFRPFAPSVLAEDSNEYFELKSHSPYMLLVTEVNQERQYAMPDNYAALDLWDRLYLERSDLPCITHLDFSARVQTVHKSTNEKYWTLINAFKKITGYSVLVNTSFNVRGEPIVCTPKDAYRCFMNTAMDYLVMNNFILKKTDQPNRENKEQWLTKFKKD
jgi:carbamoyltransferase